MWPDSPNHPIVWIAGFAGTILTFLLFVVPDLREKCISAFRHLCGFSRLTGRAQVPIICVLLLIVVLLVIYFGLLGAPTVTPVPEPAPLELPSISLIADLPESSVVSQAAPAFAPSEIEFQYRNDTGTDLVLFMLDVSMYYKSTVDPWVVMEMPAKQAGKPLRRFDKYSKGWYSFVILNKRTNEFTNIGSRQLFDKKVTRLTVVQAEPAINVQFD